MLCDRDANPRRRVLKRSTFMQAASMEIPSIGCAAQAVVCGKTIGAKPIASRDDIPSQVSIEIRRGCDAIGTIGEVFKRF